MKHWATNRVPSTTTRDRTTRNPRSSRGGNCYPNVGRNPAVLLRPVLNPLDRLSRRTVPELGVLVSQLLWCSSDPVCFRLDEGVEGGRIDAGFRIPVRLVGPFHQPAVRLIAEAAHPPGPPPRARPQGPLRQPGQGRSQTFSADSFATHYNGCWVSLKSIPLSRCVPTSSTVVDDESRGAPSPSPRSPQPRATKNTGTIHRRRTITQGRV